MLTVLSGTKNQLIIDKVRPDISPVHFPHSIIIKQIQAVAIANDASFADGRIDDAYKNIKPIAIKIAEIVIFLVFFIVSPFSLKVCEKIV